MGDSGLILGLGRFPGKEMTTHSSILAWRIPRTKELYTVFISYMDLLLYIWYMCALSVTQLCPTLWDPMDWSPPGCSVHGILQARILEWVAIPFSRGSSQPRDQKYASYVSCIAGRFFTTNSTREGQSRYSGASSILFYIYWMDSAASPFFCSNHLEENSIHQTSHRL